MCAGDKKCTKCSVAGIGRISKSKSNSKMRRGSKNQKTLITKVAGGAAGFIGGRFLNGIDFVGSNPLIGGGAKVAIGVVLASMKKGGDLVQSAGVGLGVAGVVDLVDHFVPDLGAPPISGFLLDRNPNQVSGIHQQNAMKLHVS